MPSEDNEITVVSVVDSAEVKGKILLADLRNMLEIFVQLKPMFKTILELLKNVGHIDECNNGDYGTVDG